MSESILSDSNLNLNASTQKTNSSGSVLSAKLVRFLFFAGMITMAVFIGITFINGVSTHKSTSKDAAIRQLQNVSEFLVRRQYSKRNRYVRRSSYQRRTSLWRRNHRALVKHSKRWARRTTRRQFPLRRIRRRAVKRVRRIRKRSCKTGKRPCKTDKKSCKTNQRPCKTKPKKVEKRVRAQIAIPPQRSFKTEDTNGPQRKISDGWWQKRKVIGKIPYRRRGYRTRGPTFRRNRLYRLRKTMRAKRLAAREAYIKKSSAHRKLFKGLSALNKKVYMKLRAQNGKTWWNFSAKQVKDMIAAEHNTQIDHKELIELKNRYTEKIEKLAKFLKSGELTRRKKGSKRISMSEKFSKWIAEQKAIHAKNRTNTKYEFKCPKGFYSNGKEECVACPAGSVVVKDKCVKK